MAFPYHSANLSCRCAGPQPRRINPPVWPLPISLATTLGISVDVSSSPYLDVSVQAVPFLRLFCSTQDDGVLRRRVSPFGNPRIDGYLLLPVAYRSLSRPSSAPSAKAFPLRSFLLDLRRRKRRIAPRLRLPFGLRRRVAPSAAPPFPRKPASLGFARTFRNSACCLVREYLVLF